ncbi:hypothetical protein ACPTGO_31530, partial [Pseudomonas aeruginosa]|uniref:hypothetical protein n=1 Tax=Pseudomonas aeruginosa TaxID=287 RepID=UPI003CC6C884
AVAWLDLNLMIENAILLPLTYGILLLWIGAGCFFIGVLVVYFGFGVDGLVLGKLVCMVHATNLFQISMRGLSLGLVEKD